MKPNRDESPRLFAARMLLARAKPLLKEAKGVRKGRDMECLHRMRVATRRLASVLTLFKDRFPRKHVRSWRKRLRRLRRTLGEARDLDVQIAFVTEFLRESDEFLGGLAEAEYRPGLRLLLLRLKQCRAKRQKKVVKALGRFQKQRVLADMKGTARKLRSAWQPKETGPDGIRAKAKEAILARLEDLLALEPCVAQPENIEAHHAMRIAAKRLRYTMEAFRPLYGRCTGGFIATARQVQQMLGGIHDCDVWVEFLPRFLEEEVERAAGYPNAARQMQRMSPGILFLQQNRRRHRTQLFEDFSDFWERVRKHHVWGQLAALLDAPLTKARAAPAVPSPPEAA